MGGRLTINQPLIPQFVLKHWMGPSEMLRHRERVDVIKYPFFSVLITCDQRADSCSFKLKRQLVSRADEWCVCHMSSIFVIFQLIKPTRSAAVRKRVSLISGIKCWACHFKRKKKTKQQYGLLNAGISIFVLTVFLFVLTVWNCASSISLSHILLPLQLHLSTRPAWLRHLITAEPSWSLPRCRVVVVPSENWQIMVSSSCAFTKEQRGRAGWMTGFSLEEVQLIK